MGNINIPSQISDTIKKPDNINSILSSEEQNKFNEIYKNLNVSSKTSQQIGNDITYSDINHPDRKRSIRLNIKPNQESAVKYLIAELIVRGISLLTQKNLLRSVRGNSVYQADGEHIDSKNTKFGILDTTMVSPNLLNKLFSMSSYEYNEALPRTVNEIVSFVNNILKDIQEEDLKTVNSSTK